MNNLINIKKMCGFYVNTTHLTTMLLPYINNELENQIKFTTFLEHNLKENMEAVLSRLILTEKKKEDLKLVNWEYNDAYKYVNVEKFLKNDLLNEKEVTIIVSGREEYIKAANENICKFINKNTKKIKYLNLKIIDCYEVSEFNDNIKEILDTHTAIVNTSGEHEINEIFEGYKKETGT